MTTPLTTGTGRPDSPGRGTFLRYAGLGKPVMEHRVIPYITYEGYNITPRETEYNESNGRWYRAHTKPMPGTQREFENLIRRQSLSDSTVMEELYSSRMMGSKREHIEDYIKLRDAQDPERKHELAYLKLERYHRQKESKQSARRTSSIQIVLECKLHSRNSTGATPQPPASHGSFVTQESLPLTDHVPPKPRTETSPTMPTNVSRPQYLPPYVQQRYPNRGSDHSNSQAVNNQNNRDTMDPAPTITTRKYDSDDSEILRPSSPCSTVSSDTMEPSSRRTSSSSVSNGRAPIPSQTSKEGSYTDPYATTRLATKQTGGHLSPKSSKGNEPTLLSPVSRKSTGPGIPTQSIRDHDEFQETPACSDTLVEYTSIGTQTDQGFDSMSIDHCQSSSGHCEQRKPSVKVTELIEGENLSERGCVPSDENKDEEKVVPCLEPGPHLEPGTKARDHGESNACFYKKPAWMNDLRPGSLPNAPRLCLMTW